MQDEQNDIIFNVNVNVHNVSQSYVIIYLLHMKMFPWELTLPEELIY